MKKPSGNSKSGLRMNELVAATGLAKSTILFYVGEGLLPEPAKTRPNMAYYDPGCVDRIRFIQHLKAHHRLALAEIKGILESKERGSELATYLELHEIIFGSTASRLLVDAADFCRKTGLTAAQLEQLLRARLLQPLEEKRFDPEDIAMGQVYARSLSAGLRIEDLLYYVTLGEKIVDHEMALRNRLTGGMPYPEDAAMTISMVKSARMCRSYVIDRLFQHRVAGMRDQKETRGKP